MRETLATPALPNGTPVCSLTADITVTTAGGTATVDDATWLPSGQQAHVKIGTEFLLVSLSDSTHLNLVARGTDGSTPALHTSGDGIFGPEITGAALKNWIVENAAASVDLTHADSPYTIVDPSVWLRCNCTAGDIVVHPRSGAADGDQVVISNEAGTHDVDATALGDGLLVHPAQRATWRYDSVTQGDYVLAGSACMPISSQGPLGAVVADSISATTIPNGANAPLLTVRPAAYVGGYAYSNGMTAIGSNGHVYLSITAGSGSNTGNDPTTDGGVHWIDLTAPASSGGGVGQSYLGYNAIGASTEETVTDRRYFKALTPSSDVVLTSVEAYVQAHGDWQYRVMAALYADNAGAPGRLLALNGEEVTSTWLGHDTVPRWTSIPISAKLTGGTTYWVALLFGGPGSLPDIAYDTGSDPIATPAGALYWRDGQDLTLSSSGHAYSIRASVLAVVGGSSYVGHNAIGASSEAQVDTRVYAKQVTLASDGLLTAVEAYIEPTNADSDSVGLAAFVAKDDAGAVGEIVAVTGAGASNADWTVATKALARWFSPGGLCVWLTAGTYWICFHRVTASSDKGLIYYDASGTDVTFPAAMPSDGQIATQTVTAKNYSIRARVVT